MQRQPTPRWVSIPPSWQVVSTKPKIFLVDNFLSEAEIDYIVQKATPRLQRSTTGSARSSEARTAPLADHLLLHADR